MRTATLLLCLALARDCTAGILKAHWPVGLTPQQQDYIRQYEQDIWKMVPRASKSSSQSHETNEDTSNSKEIKHEMGRWNKRTDGQGYQMTTSDLTALQEVLTLDPIVSRPERGDPEHIFEDAFEIMQHVSEEDKDSIREAFIHENEKVSEMNATQMIETSKYGVEKHVVKTDDGYYLTLFRIQPKQYSREVLSRPVVLLVHGLLGSADDWLLMGPGKSLAYQMVDAGFDVWLGNVRGSKYSRRHASKHPAQSDFWQFSIDEIAGHDLPAMIDYTLHVTQQPKLYYVGHSQATTAFFAMASTLPEYRQKVALMHALSPMVYMTHVRSPLLRMVSPKSRYFKLIQNELGHGEFKTSKNFIRSVGGKLCEDVIGNKQVCSNLHFVVSGVDTAGMDYELMPIITRHLPAGASTKQIKHYGQVKAADELRKYDHGEEVNFKVYGQPQPPKYDMTEVQVPVALYYSDEDWLAHPKDVERLHSELPDVRDFYKVPEQHFSHMDFQYSKTTPVTINQRLIDSIKQNFNLY